MYSLYIHFPFCRKKCWYCDFFSAPFQIELRDIFLNALKQEWAISSKKYNLTHKLISTIYCGGGTPSLLTPRQWSSFCNELVKECTLSDNLEWTIECNPDSFSNGKAKFWIQSGVNRLNIGVQSVIDRELKILGRVHTSEQALSVLNNPVLAEFWSVGVDIMYGIPGQTYKSLQHTLKTILDYSLIKHISAYELTFSEHTPFYRHRQIIPLPSEREIVEMNELILSMVRKRGFEQYEISNYSLPGYESKHNQAYWYHNPYIGLGPSAHSYIHPRRFANTRCINTYFSKIFNGNTPESFTEIIDKEKLSYEIIFLRLRTKKGLDENEFFLKTGSYFNNPSRKNVLDELLQEKYLLYNSPFWYLSEKGILLADAIIKRII